MITAFIQRKLRELLGIHCDSVRTEARLDKIEQSIDFLEKDIVAFNLKHQELQELVDDHYNKLNVSVHFTSNVDDKVQIAQEAVASIALATAQTEIEVKALKEELSGLALETVKGELQQ